MTPQELKNSILQLAIQGKLVEQRAEEGTGRELLEKILAAKNAKDAEKGKGKGRLTRSRGDRGDAPTSAPSASPREEISDDEKPFDLSESWVWAKLKDLGEIVTGATPKKSESDLYGGQYPFYKPAELDQGYNVTHAKETLSDVGWGKARRLSVGSVLVTCIGATIGKTGIIRREGTCNQQINAIIPCEVVSEYLYYVIISAWFQTSLKAEASRTTLPIMNKSKFENLMIPLPPLAEQKRVVAKLEELLPLCERLK
jgi:type I restriction enzyme S subunit